MTSAELSEAIAFCVLQSEEAAKSDEQRQIELNATRALAEAKRLASAQSGMDTPRKAS